MAWKWRGGLTPLLTRAHARLHFLTAKLTECYHRLSKDRCVTSVEKLSHGRHLPSKCRSRDYSSFGSTSLPSKMFSTPFLQLWLLLTTLNIQQMMLLIV